MNNHSKYYCQPGKRKLPGLRYIIRTKQQPKLVSIPALEICYMIGEIVGDLEKITDENY